METINIPIPGALYAALYERYREETSELITRQLEHLLATDSNNDVRRDNETNRPRAGTITGQVWEIADKILQDTGEIKRDAVIKACMREGINVNTANTQFSHWQKEQR